MGSSSVCQCRDAATGKDSAGGPASREPADLVGSKTGWLLWGLPAVLLVAGVFWDAARAWFWTPALSVAGVACMVNARRCGRLHCRFTGPLYLLGAVAALLQGFGILSLSWSWIAVAMGGGTALAFVPEWLKGKYAEKTF